MLIKFPTRVAIVTSVTDALPQITLSSVLQVALYCIEYKMMLIAYTFTYYAYFARHLGMCNKNAF